MQLLSRELTSLPNFPLFFQGLDPALPYFETAEPDERILPTDADLVDIIHTNSGYLSEVSIARCVSTS